MRNFLPALFSLGVLLFSGCAEAPSKTNTDLSRRWYRPQEVKEGNGQRVEADEFFLTEKQSRAQRVKAEDFYQRDKKPQR